jgi:hypothetical protein
MRKSLFFHFRRVRFTARELISTDGIDVELIFVWFHVGVVHLGGFQARFQIVSNLVLGLLFVIAFLVAVAGLLLLLHSIIFSDYKLI